MNPGKNVRLSLEVSLKQHPTGRPGGRPRVNQTELIALTACSKTMNTAAERDFDFWARSAAGAYPRRSGPEERQPAKTTQPGGFRQKPPGDFVVPRSQIHKGYAPSSRLVGGWLLAKRQYS